MAHNTKPILVDVNGKPIPQYFDPLADEYKPLLGQHGAARSILYGPDGQPIGTSGNPLQVKAQDTDDALEQIKDALGPLATETKLEAVRALLAALEGKDFATQTTLAQVKQVLDILNGAVSTSAGQADIQQAIAALAGIVAKESTLGQTKGVLDAISGKVATDQGVGLVASAVEALAQIAATENTLSQAVQKLESIVSRLQNTLTVDGEVQLKGSLPPSMMELAVNDWSELPDPTETPKGATAQLIGTFDVRQNNGAEWVEVVL